MSTDKTNATRRGSESNDLLGPLPEAPIIGVSRFGSVFRGYSADHMRAYAAEQVAAERERCAKLCEREAQAWRDVMEPDVAAGVEAVADVLRGGDAAYKQRRT